ASAAGPVSLPRGRAGRPGSRWSRDRGRVATPVRPGTPNPRNAPPPSPHLDGEPGLAHTRWAREGQEAIVLEELDDRCELGLSANKVGPGGGQIVNGRRRQPPAQLREVASVRRAGLDEQ